MENKAKMHYSLGYLENYKKNIINIIESNRFLNVDINKDLFSI